MQDLDYLERLCVALTVEGVLEGLPTGNQLDTLKEVILSHGLHDHAGFMQKLSTLVDYYLYVEPVVNYSEDDFADDDHPPFQ